MHSGVDHTKMESIFVCSHLFAVTFFIVVIFAVSGTVNAAFLERFISLRDFLILGVLSISISISLFYFICLRVQVRWEQLAFYGVIGFSLTLVLVVGYLTHGESIRGILLDDPSDVLMDFFNSVQYGRKPYAAMVIYPPLINVFYGFLGRFMLIFHGDTGALRCTQMGMLVFCFYLLIIYGTLSYLLVVMKKGCKNERILFLIAVFTSAPFLFAMDRANSVVMALFFLLLFLRYYQSDNTSLRFGSYVALAISAGIKIAPALFGILIIRSGDRRAVGIAMLVGIGIFFFPFLLTDGNIFTMLNNITHTTNMQDVVIRDGVLMNIGQGSFVNTLSIFTAWGRILNLNLSNIASTFNQILLLLGSLIVLFDKKMSMWKILALLSLIVVMVPRFSPLYNLVYLTIPLLYFLNDRPLFSKSNVLYCLLFIGIFVTGFNIRLPVFEIFQSDWRYMKLMTLIEGMCLILMAIGLLCEGGYHLTRDYLQARGGDRRLLWYRCLLGMAVVLMMATFRIYEMEQPIVSYYGANLRLINAGENFCLRDGQYRGVEGGTASVRLTAAPIRKYGLVVSFPKNELGHMEEVDLYVNGDFITTATVHDDKEAYCFISPTRLALAEQTKEIVVLLQRGNEKGQGEVLPLSYMGATQGSMRINKHSLFGYTTVGFFRDDQGIYMEPMARCLMSNQLLQQGMFIDYEVSEQLLAICNGAFQWEITANGQPLTTVIERTAGHKQFLLQLQNVPSEIRQKIEQENVLDIKWVCSGKGNNAAMIKQAGGKIKLYGIAPHPTWNQDLPDQNVLFLTDSIM